MGRKLKWDSYLQAIRESDEAALGGAFVYGYDNDTSVTSGANQFKAVVLNQDNASYTYPASFTQMPCHGRVHPCVMSDCATRTVAYYLNPSDITKKVDGTAAKLDGTDGDVMVEFEPCYYRLDQYTDGNGHLHNVFLMSVDQFPGAAYWPGFYISPGGATVRNQYVGMYQGYITGGKLHSWSGVQPTVSKSCAQFIAAGVANGGNQVNDLMFQWIFHLMITELASCNSQTDVAAGHAYMRSDVWKATWPRKTGRANAVPYKGGVLADESEGGADVDLIPDWQGTIRSENKDWTRTPASDGTGAYAWKNGSAFRYTASAAPHAGDATYSDNTLTTSADTVTSYTANKSVACKYAYIENLWGSVWENTSGTQKYQDGTELDITSDGVKYFRYEDGDVTDEHDAVTGYAWKSDADAVIYTAVQHPAVGAATYSDGACTTNRNKNITVFDEDFTQSGYWFTTDTDKYGLLADSAHPLPPGAENSDFPASGYTPGTIAWVSHPWPKGGGYPSKWDARTLYPTNASGGSAGAGLTDYFYNNADGGARALFRGGHATSAAHAGLGYVYVTPVVGDANSNIGGRLSA